MTNSKTFEFEAPARWAKALIERDASYLTMRDVAEISAFFGEEEVPTVIDCSVGTHFAWFRGTYTELVTYTAIRP